MFIRQSVLTVFILAVSQFSLSVSAAAINQDDILGYWLSESGRGVVEITRTGDVYEGKIVWAKDIHEGKVQDQLDVKNPDQALRTRSILKLKNLTGFRFKKDKWEGGKVYDPAKGKTYKSYLYMLNKDTLKLRGFVGIALFGRTSTMTRQQTSIPDSYK